MKALRDRMTSLHVAPKQHQGRNQPQYQVPAGDSGSAKPRTQTTKDTWEALA